MIMPGRSLSVFIATLVIGLWKVASVAGWTTTSGRRAIISSRPSNNHRHHDNSGSVRRQQLLLASSSHSEGEESDGLADGNNSDSPNNIQIRNPTYREMNFVADVIIKCFYANAKPPARGLFRLGELNRIQQNFPYDPAQHQMYVATTTMDDGDDKKKGEKIIGFVDIDGRQPNRPTSYKFNPRPYLSDLCVDPDYQGLGVGTRLVERCEEFCRQELLPSVNPQQDQNGNTIFIRVARDNDAAVHMYQTKMGYQEYEGEEANEKPDIVLLQKDLTQNDNNDTENDDNDDCSSADATLTGGLNAVAAAAQ